MGMAFNKFLSWILLEISFIHIAWLEISLHHGLGLK